MKTSVKNHKVRARPGRGRIAKAMTALAFVGLFTAACKDATGPETLSSLTVDPATQTVAVGGTVQLDATGERAGIDVTNLEGEVWSVTGGGTVSDTGLFTAGTTPGTSTITVACGGRTATATITVTAGPLATITVTPNPATMQIGATQQFTAVGRDALGNTVVIDPVWSAGAGGSINAETGLFTAGNTAGTFANTVRATQGTISGAATVIVTTGPVATITVTPNPETLVTNDQQQFTAVGRDAGGNIVAINPTWSVAAGGGTIVAGTGLFTAGTTVGTFPNTVTATQGTLSGTATVIVTSGPLVAITVTPNPATLGVGEQQQFTARGTDADGNVVLLVPVWTVVAGGGTINSSTGLFTAGNTAGTYPNTVVATQGSLSGRATVIVTAPAPAPGPEPGPEPGPGPGPEPGPAPAPTPPAGSAFAILANNTVTCTAGTVVGKIGTFMTAPGVTVVTSCTNSGIEEGTTGAVSAYNAFLANYDTQAATACGTTLTGTLAGRVLSPGVYCFDAAATLTGLLTLNGPSDGVWLFKVGTAAPGSLSGTNFDVVMAGGANRCNVTWWSQDAVSMTDSDLLGNVLAAGDVTFTRGTSGGNAWSKGAVTVTETAINGCP